MKLRSLVLISAATVMSSSGLFGEYIPEAAAIPARLALANIRFADPFTSMSKSVAASSLTAKTAAGFKKRQLAAAGLEAGQLLFNLAGVLGSVLAVPWVKREYKSHKFDPAYDVGVIAILSLMRSGWSIKSIIQHMKYAKNAEKLHELMQNEQFKKSLGVTDWAKVRNRRYLAEAVSAGVAATIGATGCAAAMNSEEVSQMISVENDTVESFGFIAGLSPLVVKPTISRLIRQKGSARGLEAAFNKAIKQGFNGQQGDAEEVKPGVRIAARARSRKK